MRRPQAEATRLVERRPVLPTYAYSTKPVLRRPIEPGHYTSLAFTEVLTTAGIASSIGLIGDALDNALMESTIGLNKTELLDRQRSWSGRAAVERETAAWVHWFNAERLHSTIGYWSPIEFEDYYRDHTASKLEVA